MAANKLRLAARDEWLALNREEAIEPALPIIDTHHHLGDRPGRRYLFPDFLSDLTGGHDIRFTVLVQSTGSMYRAGGDPNFAPVGEVEFANGVAAMSASGQYGPARICAGIVGYADLRLGSRVQPVLEALLRASPDRFKGVRYMLNWDAMPELGGEEFKPRLGLMQNAGFLEGLACLSPLGLSFDMWVYQTQLDDAASLMRKFPHTQFVLNHLGGPVHIGPYAGKREEMFSSWQNSLREIARMPNVYMKLGGIGMPYAGFDFHAAVAPPSSSALAEAWTPYIQTCIELFGVDRCMFESNFPVDKATCNFVTLWNALKRSVRGASDNEKQALFYRTAALFYRLPDVQLRK